MELNSTAICKPPLIQRFFSCFKSASLTGKRSTLTVIYRDENLSMRQSLKRTYTFITWYHLTDFLAEIWTHKRLWRQITTEIKLHALINITYELTSRDTREWALFPFLRKWALVTGILLYVNKWSSKAQISTLGPFSMLLYTEFHK